MGLSCFISFSWFFRGESRFLWFFDLSRLSDDDEDDDELDDDGEELELLELDELELIEDELELEVEFFFLALFWSRLKSIFVRDSFKFVFTFKWSRMSLLLGRFSLSFSQFMALTAVEGKLQFDNLIGYVNSFSPNRTQIAKIASFIFPSRRKSFHGLTCSQLQRAIYNRCDPFQNPNSFTLAHLNDERGLT